MSAPIDARTWASIRHAAETFGVSTKTIRRMITRGELYAERIGPRLIRVDLASIVRRPIGSAQ